MSRTSLVAPNALDPHPPHHAQNPTDVAMPFEKRGGKSLDGRRKLWLRKCRFLFFSCRATETTARAFVCWLQGKPRPADDSRYHMFEVKTTLFA